MELLSAVLAVYERRAEAMAAVISREMGAPIALARVAQAAVGRSHIEAFTDVLRNVEFEHPVRPVRPDGPDAMILHEAIGVCGAFSPLGTVPINQVTLKVIPALAAGCTGTQTLRTVSTVGPSFGGDHG